MNRNRRVRVRVVVTVFVLKMLSKLAAWFPVSQDVPGSLTWMSLGPDNNTKNPLMVFLPFGGHLLTNPQRYNSLHGIVLALT
jgi:hypothetical protein